MHPESSRSRPPNGLFSDETSASSSDARRSVSEPHPYRGTRESLIEKRHALEKELAAVDSRIAAHAGAPAEAPPAPLVRLTDLGAIFFARRAIGVVLAGVLAGVGVSSLAAFQRGAPRAAAEAERHELAEVARRMEPPPQDESVSDHMLRRRKEGEAMLMSALFREEPPDSSPEVVRVAPNAWAVYEALFERQDFPTVRMVPHLTHDGRVDGIAVFGLRPDGLPAQLGLENGDVLLRANGIELAGADGALAAHESWRRTRDLIVEIQRRGQVITQHYLIVPS